MKKSVYIAVLLAAVALAYSNTLVNSFTWDDDLYIELNPQVVDVSASALFAPNKITNVFRPMTFATLALNWKLGGTRPFGYHLLNLFLHMAVTLLLFLLFETLLTDSSGGEASPHDTLVAFAAALVFAVHPIHTEAVSSVVGRAEMLACAFVLLAWISHLKGRIVAALICFALALLSKESAAVFLPLMVISDYARGKWSPRFHYALLTAATLFYLAILWRVQGEHFGAAHLSSLDNPLASLPAGWRILNASRVGWKYVALLFYPDKLSFDYSFNAIPVYRDFRHTLPALIAGLVIVGAWIGAIYKRRSTFVLAGGIYLIGFAATANILVPTGTIMGERLAYLPSAGFCLLVALGWKWLRDRQQRMALAILTVIVAAFSIRTMRRNGDWKDNLALAEGSVRAAPGSVKVHSSLGAEYMTRGRIDLASLELQTSLKIDPNYPNALESYGIVQSTMGNYPAAAVLMERALEASPRDDPNYDFMAVNLAGVLMQTGHLDRALDLLNRDIAESPRYARAWANRAVLHFKLGEMTPARDDAETALRLEPDNSQAKKLIRLLDDRASTPSAAP